MCMPGHAPDQAQGRTEASVSDLLQQLNAEIASVADDVKRSLVQITNGRGGAGAGTIWHADGLIVTNAHVISGRHSLHVTLPDGQTLPAKVLAQDETRDLAALAVDATGLPTIEPGDSRQLKPGHWVFAVGHPWGVRGAVTAGIVIGVGSQWPEMPPSGQDYVVVSLKVRPGNSGGPLVDVRGRLVGVNSMMTGPNVGVAVPSHVVKAFLREALGTPRAEPVPEGVL
jgi:serine protease Do